MRVIFIYLYKKTRHQLSAHILLPKDDG